MTPALIASILGAEHPDYVRYRAAWARGERLMAGGGDVYSELLRYTWETEGSDEYLARQAVAVYPDLPAQCAEEFVGTLFQSPPPVSWGELGEVRATADRVGKPSRAELIYDNVDGTGEDARGWDAFWYDEMARAMATGHRWIQVEAPATRATNLADEIAGARPYLVGRSPLAVPNWRFSDGRLDFARVVVTEEVSTVEGDVFKQEPRTLHYLLVRKGYTGFGDDFAGGGWWLFDADGVVVTDADGTERAGTWDATGGEIPMFRLYYDRPDDRTVPAGETAAAAPVGRVGLSHLGNCAVALMNLSSALFNDAWVAGSRKLFFLGADPTQWEQIVDGVGTGGVYIPVPSGVTADGTGGKVDIYDTGETTGGTAILSAIAEMKATAKALIRREAETSAESSGVARRIAYKGGASPRLASMATSIEDAQNIALTRIQQRWGVATGGGVTWPKEYDLRTVTERAQGVVDLLSGAKATSATLVSEAITAAADKEGLLGSVDAKTVKGEIAASVNATVAVDAFFTGAGAASGDGQTGAVPNIDPATAAGGNAAQGA